MVFLRNFTKFSCYFFTSIFYTAMNYTKIHYTVENRSETNNTFKLVPFSQINHQILVKIHALIFLFCKRFLSFEQSHAKRKNYTKNWVTFWYSETVNLRFCLNIMCMCFFMFHLLSSTAILFKLSNFKFNVFNFIFLFVLTFTTNLLF